MEKPRVWVLVDLVERALAKKGTEMFFEEWG